MCPCKLNLCPSGTWLAKWVWCSADLAAFCTTVATTKLTGREFTARFTKSSENPASPVTRDGMTPTTARQPRNNGKSEGGCSEEWTRVWWWTRIRENHEGIVVRGMVDVVVMLKSGMTRTKWVSTQTSISTFPILCFDFRSCNRYFADRSIFLCPKTLLTSSETATEISKRNAGLLWGEGNKEEVLPTYVMVE